MLADGKRGDVPVTAAAYAQALVGSTPTPYGPVQGLGADCFTVNPLLGRDSLEPLVDAAAEHGAGVFALVSTSNPGAADLQDLDAGGRPLHEHVAALVDAIGADHVGQCGLSLAGAVTGATRPERLARLRELMPRAVFLLPGVGAQGGDPAALADAFRPHPAAGLVTASRSIVNAYADRGGDPAAAARDAAAGTAEDHLGALARLFSASAPPSGRAPRHGPSTFTQPRPPAGAGRARTDVPGVRVRDPQLARGQRRRARVRHLDGAQVGHPGQHRPPRPSPSRPPTR